MPVDHTAPACCSQGTRANAPVLPTRSPRQGISLDDVMLGADGFWGRLQKTNSAATLEHCREWMERLGWLENFDRVARGETLTDRPGWEFSDSEVYKLLEAMAWQLGRHREVELERAFDALVARVAAAQDDDGYLCTAYGHPGLPARYSDLSSGHELYNLGHLMQAAVARVRTVGAEDELVEVARRAADHVCESFGPGRSGICGHPEVEVALTELGRALDEARYIEQARLFVERRGHRTLPVRPLLSAEYFQDDQPVREAEVLRGHAVRALYLSAGAVDVAVETGDGELLDALVKQWRRTVERRTYITGGMGSRHQDEGFGEDWELPPDRAYCETCAGIAAVMFSWRLYLATGGVEYADFIERVLYNVVAASPSADGRAFFYSNPLHQREPGESAISSVNMRAEGSTRAPWFDVSCCPTNVARTLASVDSCFAATDEEALTLLQYASGTYRSPALTVDVRTEYPAHGAIAVTVLDAAEGPVTLRLRVPSWADGAALTVGSEPARTVAPGWSEVTRTWQSGDHVLLDLPVAPRFSWPHPRIDAVRGTVAVERGPLVLALESEDLPDGWNIDDVRVHPGVPPERAGDGAAVRAALTALGGAGGLPYSADPVPAPPTCESALRLIPYHRWAERGPSTMRVFLPAQH